MLSAEFPAAFFVLPYIGKKRVVFTKAKDPLTGIQEYRFVGFFIGDHYDENGTITYKRIDDKFKIIKK